MYPRDGPFVPGELPEDKKEVSEKDITTGLNQTVVSAIKPSHTGDFMLKITEEPFLQRDLGFQDGLVLGLRRPTGVGQVGLRHGGGDSSTARYNSEVEEEL